MLRSALILFASVCALEPVTTRPKTSRRRFVAGAAASLAFPRAASAALSDYKTELFSESGCGRRGILGACTGGAAPTVDKTAAEAARTLAASTALRESDQYMRTALTQLVTKQKQAGKLFASEERKISSSALPTSRAASRSVWKRVCRRRLRAAPPACRDAPRA